MSEVSNENLKLEQLEDLVRQVQGVISARIVWQNSEVQEIHVLANSIRNPKQVVRDIETIALVKLGISLDHRKISVVQMQEEPEGESRIKLVGTSFKRTGQQVTVTVELSLEEQVFTGQALGPNTAGNQLRLAGKAAAEALERCLEIENLFVIEDMSKVTLGGRQAVAACVTMVSDRGEEVLLGIVPINGDAFEAAAKAVLAAVNRRVCIISKNKS